MKFYNMMSGCGFVETCGFSKPFILAWLGLLILAIIIMLGKKWLGEEEAVGYPYNWFASILGAITYIFMISFTGSAKWSLLVGLIGTIGIGYLAGIFFGGTSD